MLDFISKGLIKHLVILFFKDFLEFFELFLMMMDVQSFFFFVINIDNKYHHSLMNFAHLFLVPIWGGGSFLVWSETALLRHLTK